MFGRAAWCALGVLTVASLALAEPSAEDAKAASRSYEAATKAYSARRYAEAITLFEEALRQKAHPSIYFNIGKCAEQLGDTARALRAYRAYLRENPRTADRKVVERAIGVQEKKLQDLGLHQLMVLVTPADARVSVNGKAIGTGRSFVELGEGQHQLVVEKEGFERFSLNFATPSSGSLELSVELVAGQSAPPPPPPVVMGPEPRHGEVVPVTERPVAERPVSERPVSERPVAVTTASGAPRTGAWILAAGGAAVFAVGAVFSVLALVEWQNIGSTTWRAQNDWKALDAERSNYSRNVVMGPALAGAGAAALVTGLVLALAPARPAVVALWVDAERAGLTVGGHF